MRQLPPKVLEKFILNPLCMYVCMCVCVFVCVCVSQSSEKKRKIENGRENRSFFHFSNFEDKFKNTKNTVNG